jgi:hypothetical protein
VVFPEVRILALASDKRRALKAGADAALSPSASPAAIARAAAGLLVAR